MYYITTSIHRIVLLPSRNTPYYCSITESYVVLVLECYLQSYGTVVLHNTCTVLAPLRPYYGRLLPSGTTRTSTGTTQNLPDELYTGRTNEDSRVPRHWARALPVGDPCLLHRAHIKQLPPTARAVVPVEQNDRIDDDTDTNSQPSTSQTLPIA